MIDRVLTLWKVADVADRYPWWTPPTMTDYMYSGSFEVSTTDRALERRGLAVVVRSDFADRPDRPETFLTKPGELMGLLLIEAGFEVPKTMLGFAHGVPPHPDDLDDLGGRHVGKFRPNADGSGFEIERLELPPDRRLDIWEPGDEHYYAELSVVDRKIIEARIEAARDTEPAPA